MDNGKAHCLSPLQPSLPHTSLHLNTPCLRLYNEKFYFQIVITLTEHSSFHGDIPENRKPPLSLLLSMYESDKWLFSGTELTPVLGGH
jgi:hypothetical protein